MSAEVKLKSGSVVGITRIKSEIRNAIIRATVKAARRITIDKSTIAKDTGLMRQQVSQKIEPAFRKEVVKATLAKKKIRIDGNRIAVSLGVSPHYAKYHIRQHPLFNPKFFAGYKNPTTPGTKPINMNEVMREFAVILRNALRKELMARGFEVG